MWTLTSTHTEHNGMTDLLQEHSMPLLRCCKLLSVTVRNSYFYNALNVGQLHQGVELEAKARPFANLKLRGMLSVGNWKYKGDARFQHHRCPK